VELNQAILCDDMPALSGLQIGPTGKSVARSYANALGKLVPSGKLDSFECSQPVHLWPYLIQGTTTGIDERNSMNNEQKRYKHATAVLSAEAPHKTGLSVVELYAKKQAIYTKAVAEKNQAFRDALQHAQQSPVNKTTEQVVEAYEAWVQQNATTYRSYVQAAYMDWVITGRKEEVEYWFAVVDQDSALSLVERSKVRHVLLGFLA
jgi:hypothetical protein